MAKSAFMQRTIVDHPSGGSLGHLEYPRFVRHIIKCDQSADYPTIFTRIDVLVDTRHAKFAPSRIVQRVELVPIGFAIEVRVLADIESARRSRQKVRKVAFDVACGREVFRVLPQRESLAVLAQILRLE